MSMTKILSFKKINRLGFFTEDIMYMNHHVEKFSLKNKSFKHVKTNIPEMNKGHVTIVIFSLETDMIAPVFLIIHNNKLFTIVKERIIFV